MITNLHHHHHQYTSLIRQADCGFYVTKIYFLTTACLIKAGSCVLKPTRKEKQSVSKTLTYAKNSSSKIRTSV